MKLVDMVGAAMVACPHDHLRFTAPYPFWHMFSDSESAYHHSFSSHEHDTKVILHNNNPFILTKDNHFMIDMLNIENEAPNEGKHGTITSTIERKSPKLMDSPKYFYEEEDPINSNKGDRECTEAPYCAPTSGIGMVIKEDFYTDRNVSKIESPEMRVCIDVDRSRIVEDVSIDEGIRFFEKTMIEKEKLVEKESSIFSQSMENKCNDMTKEMEVSGSSHDLNCALFNRDEINIVEKAITEIASVHNDFDGKGSYVGKIDRGSELDTAESVEGNLSADTTENLADVGSIVHNDSDGNKSSLSSTESGGRLNSTESVVSNISAEVTEIRLPSEEISNEHLQGDSSSLVFSNDRIQPVVDRQIIQGKAEETNSGSTALSFPSEVSELSNESKEITSNCKVPSGVITFKFDNQAASSSGREENEESRENQQSEIAENSFGIEEAKTDGATAAARCSFLHVIQEESNFSGPALLSGPIANSGHIPYSGSISLRSDSSATSARSFAFPILQSEWNSSPVKMAKADRRHLRKHRGWRMGLLCCRF